MEIFLDGDSEKFRFVTCREAEMRRGCEWNGNWENKTECVFGKVNVWNC